MAKSLQMMQARKLRAQGVSVRDIAQKLQVSKSTASLWVRDIILSLEQLEKLRHQKIMGGEKGRILGSLKQKQDRLLRIQKGINKGKLIFPTITDRELLIAGIALYWAEGTKKKREVTFCNSDPKLVEFMIRWLQRSFDVPISRLRCCVGINEIHRQRDDIVKKYWSGQTGIPLDRFTKTSFKKVRNKKIYLNFHNHYGTLTVKVNQPAQLHYDILGLIEGLYQAK